MSSVSGWPAGGSGDQYVDSAQWKAAVLGRIGQIPVMAIGIGTEGDRPSELIAMVMNTLEY